MKNFWKIKEVRILSVYFLTKKSLNWIFNSRLTTIQDHLKCRINMIKGMQNPE